MSASGKRAPPSNAAPVPSAADEDEELERIATMNDEDLDAHLAHSGVDVADLDAQVDSIREQIVSSRIGAQALPVTSGSERAIGGADDEPDGADVQAYRRFAIQRFGTLGKAAAICLVVAVAIAGGTALASLLR